MWTNKSNCQKALFKRKEYEMKLLIWRTITKFSEYATKLKDEGKGT